MTSLLRYALLLSTGILLSFETRLAASEYSHVTDAELSVDVQRRQSDLTRTADRITDLTTRIQVVQEEIQVMTERIDAIDARLVERTAILYRLSRNGKSVQYLLSSDSAITFLKRIQTLRKLVTSEMDLKRAASLALSESMDEVTQLNEKRQGAIRFQRELENTIEELLREQQRRGGESGSGGFNPPKGTVELRAARNYGPCSRSRLRHHPLSESRR
jgi:peptidoglycan hydrolase CwlO-like protein